MERRKFSIRDKIREIYSNLFSHFKEDKEKKKVSYTEFIGDNKEERIISFLPLIHLENQKKVLLEQSEHFSEIFIWLREVYLKHNPAPLEELKKELKEQMEKEMKKMGKNKSSKKRLEKTNKEFSEPLGEM